MLLEEHELWYLVEKMVTLPPEAGGFANYNKNMSKKKQVILNQTKDPLIPHIIRNIGKEMFDVLVTLYQSENINQKMLMRNNLGATQMSKRNIIASYLMKITELYDQLEAVGEEVEGEEFVPTTLNGFSSYW